MFEDICFTCSRPVDSGSVPPLPLVTERADPAHSVAYCSDECALHDTAPAGNRSDSGLSSGSLSPYLAPYAQHAQAIPSKKGTPDARHFVDGHPVAAAPLPGPFVLHNPHPDYPLPLALAASPRSPGFKHPSSKPPAMLHTRKPPSVSSSSASSALSTPSAPPLTDDEDSMSDPEFLLDPRVDMLPAGVYARRPSGNSTTSRAPVAPGLSSCSSVSTSNSAHIVSPPGKESPHGNRTPSRARRPRHAYHLSVPTLVEGLNKLFVADDPVRPRYIERPQSFTVEPEDNYRIRADEREASYATLTKFSVATKAAELIANPKSRQTPTTSRPRSSLPAYLSLMKFSSPSPQGVRSPSPPKKNLTRPQSLRNLHKSSATVAHSHETASTATLSGSFSPASVRTATAASATIARSLRNASSRESSPFVGDRTASPAGNSDETRSPTLRSGSIPITVAATPKETAVSHQERYDPKIRPLQMKNAIGDCEGQGGGACSGTPRGRTRSRSNRPRSRSRSRSQERARRAHFNGTPPTNISGGRFERDASAAFAGRGRPHVRGGMPGRVWHVRRTDGECGQSGRESVEIDWLDAQDGGCTTTSTSNTTSTITVTALAAESEAERLRGRRRMPLRA